MLVSYSAAIDVPNLDEGIRFYRGVFGFEETARPVEGYVTLTCADSSIGLLEKPAGTKPAEGANDVRRYERHWTPVHIDFRVDDFEEMLERALTAGARIEQKFDGGNHSPIAFCSDPFGNGFCVLGKKPST